MELKDIVDVVARLGTTFAAMADLIISQAAVEPWHESPDGRHHGHLSPRPPDAKLLDQHKRHGRNAGPRALIKRVAIGARRGAEGKGSRSYFRHSARGQWSA